MNRVIKDKKESLARKKSMRFNALNIIEDDLSFDEKELEFGLN